MNDTADLEPLSEEILERFLVKLKAHVRRRNAPGVHRNALRDFVSRLEVRRSESGLVLAIREWIKKTDADAYSALNRLHMPVSFTAKEGGPEIAVQELRRVDGSRSNHFIPSTIKAGIGAEVCHDPGYARLWQKITELPAIGEVTLIQHSGESSAVLTTLLLSRGADVRLLMQSSDSALPPGEATRMEELYKDMRKRFWKDGGRLRIFRYNFPASMRAVLVHGQLVCVGWYNYFADGNGQYTIYGHNQPYLFARRGTESFIQLSEMIIAIADAAEAHFTPAPVLEWDRVIRDRDSTGDGSEREVRR